MRSQRRVDAARERRKRMSRREADNIVEYSKEAHKRAA